MTEKPRTVEIPVEALSNRPKAAVYIELEPVLDEAKRTATALSCCVGRNESDLCANCYGELRAAYDRLYALLREHGRLK